MIRNMVIAFVLGVLGGLGVGVKVTWDFHRVAQLKAEVAAYKKHQQGIREVLGLNETLDGEADAADKSNQEILNAIRESTPEPVTQNRGCPPRSLTQPITCVSAERMRLLSKLR